MIRRLDSTAPGFGETLRALVRGDEGVEQALQDQVAAIIADVRARGDAAVLEYTRRFDQRASVRSRQLELPRERLREALDGLSEALGTALRAAAERVERYHREQRQDDWEITDEFGNRLGQRVTPLDRVGVYVPGGKASYPSSVLMNALPARVAGVREIIMVVPAPAGALSDLVLAAACLAGVDRVITIGGAQAVAALAYGTESIPAVDKIVGPGNRYVAEAKRQVFGRVGIDMVAGPSEVLVIADGSADPEWIAQDLFAQAEHDENAQAVLVSPDAGLLDAVEAALDRMLPGEPRAPIIAASLARRGALVQVPDLDAAAEVSNSIAPEHLELAVADPRALLPRIRSAGAIFLGHHSSESLGDYCAGPNHVLPTGGSARFFSPLGVYDFQKRSSVIDCTEAGAAALAEVAATLARGESLEAHARSAELRGRR